jgi:hypothetical protein
MKAFRTYVTVSDPKKLILTDLPFRAGERVEALFLARDSGDAELPDAVRALCAETRALPQVQALTEEDIAAEIKAHRRRACE